MAEKYNISVEAVDIPLSEIDPNPYNAQIFSMKDIESLAVGIEEEGFFGAVEVYRKDDGRYELSSGHRRYEAVKRLGHMTIPCIISEMPDDAARMRKLISSNIRSRNLSPIEKARAIQAFEQTFSKKEAKEMGETRRKIIADFFCMSESMVQKYKALLKLIPELQELMLDPNIPYSAFLNARNLPVREQKKLYNTLCEYIDDNRQAFDNGELELTRPRIEQLIRIIQEEMVALEKEKARIKAREEYEAGIREIERNRKRLKEIERTSKELEKSVTIGDPFKAEGDDFIFEKQETIDLSVPQLSEADSFENKAQEALNISIPNIEPIDVKLSVLSQQIEKLADGNIYIKDKENIRVVLEGMIEKINTLKSYL